MLFVKTTAELQPNRTLLYLQRNDTHAPLRFPAIYNIQTPGREEQNKTTFSSYINTKKHRCSTRPSTIVARMKHQWNYPPHPTNTSFTNTLRNPGFA